MADVARQLGGDTFNIMILSLLIVVAVLVASFVVLFFITKNIYLDSYFVLDAFFDAQNTAASSALARIAFASNAYVFAAIFVVVIVDNLSRILITSFILAAVIDLLGYANIEEQINEARARFMKRHVIICGYNELAWQLMQRLKSGKIKCIVMVQDQEQNKELNAQHVVNLALDFTEERSLLRANIRSASAVVLASEDDASNVLGALVARKLNPSIKIVSRLKDEHARKKVYTAGADMAVIPEHLAGLEMGEFIRKSVKAM
ncbi:MAG: potassium channel family protein [Candidatus Micrarchaeia archaeon]